MLTLDRFLNRFKDSIKNHPDLVEFIQEFAGWFDTWAADVNSSPPAFQDTITSADPATRRLVLNQLRHTIRDPIEESTARAYGSSNIGPFRVGAHSHQMASMRPAENGTVLDITIQRDNTISRIGDMRADSGAPGWGEKKKALPPTPAEPVVMIQREKTQFDDEDIMNGMKPPTPPRQLSHKASTDSDSSGSSIIHSGGMAI